MPMPLHAQNHSLTLIGASSLAAMSFTSEKKRCDNSVLSRIL